MRPNWMPIFLTRYTAIVDEHADVAVFQDFGHEHVDTFRLAGSRSVLFSVPSLSTAYPRTNPTVRLWHTLPAQGVVQDWTQYHMDLIASNKRHEPLRNVSYTASKEYGLLNLTRPSMEALLARFKAESRNASVTSTVYQEERRFFMSSTPEKYQPKCDLWCQTTDLCDKEYGSAPCTEVGFLGCVYWNAHDILRRSSAAGAAAECQK